MKDGSWSKNFKIAVIIVISIFCLAILGLSIWFEPYYELGLWLPK